MINDSSTIELTAITLFKSSSTWSHLFTFNNEKKSLIRVDTPQSTIQFLRSLSTVDGRTYKTY